MSPHNHWHYMATRRFYGRTRAYSLIKALRLYVLWRWYRKSDETVRVTCWKCEEPHTVPKRLLYYYDNTKCGGCYL